MGHWRKGEPLLSDTVNVAQRQNVFLLTVSVENREEEASV